MTVKDPADYNEEKNMNIRKENRSGKAMIAALGLLILILFTGCSDPSGSDGDGGETPIFPLNMVSVPSGSFQYSSASANISNVSSFYMSKCEITRAQFEEIMGTDPSDTYYSTGSNDPVQNVNWYHAIAFCNKLSIKEGLTSVYSVTASGEELDWANLAYSDIPTSSVDNWNDAVQNMGSSGYRLPTQMEWLWAAMGASSDNTGTWNSDNVNTSGYDKGYSGSSESGSAYKNIADYVWYKSNSEHKIHPVGTRAANELGICDMSGNVFEWCWDRNVLPSGTVTDYNDNTSTSSRMIRGGAWSSDYSSQHFTYKMQQNAYALANWYGFRVVKR